MGGVLLVCTSVIFASAMRLESEMEEVPHQTTEPKPLHIPVFYFFLWITVVVVYLPFTEELTIAGGQIQGQQRLGR
jgi:hypothetical protein